LLPGSGSAKTWGSKDPDPRGKKTAKKIYSVNPNLIFEKRDYENFLISDWFEKYFFLLKKFSKS